MANQRIERAKADSQKKKSPDVCRRGHVDQRLPNGDCYECRKIRNRLVVHTPHYRARRNAYLKARRQSDPAYRLDQAIRCQMRRAMREVNAQQRTWREVLGYTADDLREHIGRQFAPGMTWENYGEWHIDHIVPVSSFNFKSVEDPEFRACWALSNLRPLWAKDNLKKHAKRTQLL
ncbi:hypothetical protein GRI72_02885 [Altererythrobacter marinus]|uniref:HNH endonuclease n=1 Tax=Pelagerythrobacter marinus TaxID=538382 RepID=A0ABW9UUG6_9SPHN|nr:hypothetical protein [Pelagerythrobacter marinus]MXO67778.1 hypothetical protein [Pelagerythrobacter marinus]